MKRKTALIAMTGVDIFAIYAIYSVFETRTDIFEQISHRANEITYQTGSTFGVVMLVIPLLHLWGFIETFGGKRITRKVLKWANWGFIATSAILFIVSLLIANGIYNALDSAGYVYSVEKSKIMRVSEFRVYVLDEQ